MDHWKEWCNTCGNYELVEEISSESSSLMRDNLKVKLSTSNICVDCKSYLEDVQQFIFKAQAMSNMYDDIAEYQDTEGFSLIDTRVEFGLPVPDYLDYEEIKEVPEEIINEDIQLEALYVGRELQEEVEINNSKSLMMTIEGNLFDDRNLEFDIQPIPSMIQQSYVEIDEEIDDKDPRKFKCNQCDKRFKVKVHLQTHLAVHLPDDEKFVHQCELCDKKYSSHFCLRQHIRHVHEKPVKFKCQFCGKSFSRKANLDSHLSHVHTKDKNFECDICGIKVKSKAILRNHRILHSTDPSVMKQCKYCTKQFKTQNQLINHESKHKKNKNSFTCSICSVTFLRAKQLETHVKSFHKSIS